MATALAHKTQGTPAVFRTVKIKEATEPIIESVFIEMTGDEAKFVHAVIGIVSQSGVFENFNEGMQVKASYDKDGLSIYESLGDVIYGSVYDGPANNERHKWALSARKWATNHFSGRKPIL